MNKERMLKVADAVENMEDDFEMAWYFLINTSKDASDSGNGHRPPKTLKEIKYACGTSCCIAGETVRLGLQSGEIKPLAGIRRGTPEFFFENAKNYLDLTDYQASILFASVNWPSPFFGSYTGARLRNDQRAMKKAGADCIRFLAEQWR